MRTRISFVLAVALFVTSLKAEVTSKVLKTVDGTILGVRTAKMGQVIVVAALKRDGVGLVVLDSHSGKQIGKTLKTSFNVKRERLWINFGVSPDGRLAAVSNFTHLLVYDLNQKKIIYENLKLPLNFPLNSHHHLDISFSSKGRFLAVSWLKNQALLLADLKEAKLLQDARPKFQGGNVRRRPGCFGTHDFFPNKPQIAVANYEKLEIFSLGKNAKKINSYKMPFPKDERAGSTSLVDIAVSPDGSRIAVFYQTIGGNKNLYILDSKNGKVKQHFSENWDGLLVDRLLWSSNSLRLFLLFGAKAASWIGYIDICAKKPELHKLSQVEGFESQFHQRPSFAVSKFGNLIYYPASSQALNKILKVKTKQIK